MYLADEVIINYGVAQLVIELVQRLPLVYGTSTGDGKYIFEDNKPTKFSDLEKTRTDQTDQNRRDRTAM